MYQVTKRFTFEASHVLELHDGKCSRLHGHNFVVEVTCRAGKLIEEGPKTNMVKDFGDIKERIKPAIDLLDHQHLNEVMGTNMPTAEFIAAWFVKNFYFPTMYKVRVYETPDSWAEVFYHAS